MRPILFLIHVFRIDTYARAISTKILSVILPFIFELCGRSWASFLSAIGTTGLGFFVSNILLFAATVLVTLAVIWAKKGKAAMIQHAAENLKIGVFVYCIVLVTAFGPVFCYQLFVKIPRSIRYEADRVKPPTVLAPKPPSLALIKSAHATPLPSFVFAVPAVVVNGDTWDFIIKHEGEREVESIDLMFVDAEKLHAIQKATPPQTDVLPSEYSVLLHVDKMYPRGRGSLFAKQFIWKPYTLEHEHYTVEISASTGRFHEDLFVEKAEGKWTDAARVEEIDTKEILFVCRDSGFPHSVAPKITAKRNCFPDWIK